MRVDGTQLDAPVLVGTIRDFALQSMRDNWESLRVALESVSEQTLTLSLRLEVEFPAEVLKPLAAQVLAELQEKKP